MTPLSSVLCDYNKDEYERLAMRVSLEGRTKKPALAYWRATEAQHQAVDGATARGVKCYVEHVTVGEISLDKPDDTSLIPVVYGPSVMYSYACSSSFCVRVRFYMSIAAL